MTDDAIYGRAPDFHAVTSRPIEAHLAELLEAALAEARRLWPDYDTDTLAMLLAGRLMLRRRREET